MFYIHPFEIGSVCPEPPGLSLFWKFRYYVGRKKTKQRFASLFADFSFGRVDKVLQLQGFLP